MSFDVGGNGEGVGRDERVDCFFFFVSWGNFGRGGLVLLVGCLLLDLLELVCDFSFIDNFLKTLFIDISLPFSLFSFSLFPNR